MSRARFTEELKRDAVAQVVDRGYAVSEVAERLGTPLTGRRLHSNRREGARSRFIHGARFSKPAKDVRIDTGQSREIRRLKAELARVTEERDILKKATVYFARDAK